jgi:hypothetical protein
MKYLYSIVLSIMLVSTASAFQCRNPAVKHKFDVLNHHPHGNKGFIVDHICALANGGLDITTNMQYQTPTDSHQKDLIENTEAGRKLFCTPENSLPYRTVFNC